MLFTFSLSSSLGIDIISAIFHSKGEGHVSIEQLNYGDVCWESWCEAVFDNANRNFTIPGRLVGSC